MIDTKEVTINENVFSIQQFTGFETIKLLRKSAGILKPLIPIFEGMKGLDLNFDIDVSKIIDGLVNTLTNLSENEFIDYVENMVKNVSVREAGKGQYQPLKNKEIYNSIFAAKPYDIFILIFHVMKINGFFDLGAGLGLDLTDLFSKVTKEEKK